MNDMRPETIPKFTPNLGSQEANLANEKALAGYQRALKEHVIMQRALEGGYVNTSSAVKERLDAHIVECEQRGVESDSPKEVARFAYSLMAAPSQLFPQIARAVETEVNSIKVDALVKLFNPDHNKKLAKLHGDSKGALKALGSNTSIVRTLQCELLHERQFSTGSSVNSIAHRLEKWVNSGARQGQRAARWGITLGVALGGGPAGLLGLTVNNLADYFMTVKEKGLSKTVKRAFEAVGSIMGKGAAAGRECLKEWNDFLDKKTNTPQGRIALGAYALAVTYAGYYAAGISLEVYQYDLDDLVKAAKDMNYDFPSISKSPWVNLLAGGFFGALAKKLQDRFDFDKATSPLKNNPFQVQEPSISIREAQWCEAEKPSEYQPNFEVEPLQEEVICQASEWDSSSMTPQKRQPHTPASMSSPKNGDTTALNTPSPKEDCSPRSEAPSL